MKHTRRIIIKILALLSLSLALFSTGVRADISPGLQASLDNGPGSDGDSLVDIVVFLEQADLRVRASAAAANMSFTRGQRLQSVTDALRAYRHTDEEAIRRFLNLHSRTPVRRNWIVPAFTAKIPVRLVESLAELPGVALVTENAVLLSASPVDTSAAEPIAATVSNELQLLNVPTLWNQGLKGQGRLICSFDTGVERSHPALADKWRGNHAPLSSAWFSTVTPNAPPSDRTGHGTHTMGILVGATPLDTFGVAPAAEWITAGVIDQGGPLGTTISDILDAFEWALDPDGNPATSGDVPDVILNSWGIPKGLFTPCDQTFFTVIDNVEAAGIVTVFAAGNEGPSAASMRSPADRASTPTNTLAVGAVNIGLAIAGFSSRGPSSCDATQVKPEVVAPGVSVRSSFKGGGYLVMSGTSMAAPYVAGLALLLRQYNPNATVEQIKTAIIQSCADLGVPGEDNTFGFGFPDAALALSYLPPAEAPRFSLERIMIAGDGIASPGEEFGLQLLLSNDGGSVELVQAHLISLEPGDVVIPVDEATFNFGVGGSSAVNEASFVVAFDSSLYHGRQVSFRLVLSDLDSTVRDSLSLTLTVGIAPHGTIAEHTTDQLTVTVSDFGQFGCAPGSIYNLDGAGFRYLGSPNLLYEAGIVVARSPLQMSRAVRDSLGSVCASDFRPIDYLGTGSNNDGGSHLGARLDDGFSAVRIPITVTQQTSSYPMDHSDGWLLVRYLLKNDSSERLTGLYFGILVDFDLIGSGDRCVYDAPENLVYQFSDTGPIAGLLALDNLTSFQSIENAGVKRGFTSNELFNLMSSGVVDVSDAIAGDRMFLAAGGPFSINPSDSVPVVFALVAGDNVNSLYDNAVTARERFQSPTDVDDNLGTLPAGFALHQNYPNPFNPTTTISFSLPRAEHVRLDIFNLLGQRVRTLADDLFPAGSHNVTWDGADSHGRPVASGVYLYRLSAASGSHARKMVLLK